MSDGVIVYDKPAGMTSHDVVASVRRGLGRRVKVGHAGTLDPFATGLLLVLVGRATRVQRFLMELPKTYYAVARFGAVSSTGDPEGEITRTGNVPSGALELPEREVIVYRFEELWGDGERRGFEIECSSGTYVRSLIADLGDAYCEELRRTRIGHFAVERADPERVIALDHALGFLPEVRLDRERALRLAHGRPVEAAAEGLVRATDEAGLIALAEPVASDQIRPVVGFRG